MINCEKATYLVEKRELNDLTLREKLSLKLHTLMCKLCKCYESDSKLLGRLMKALGAKKRNAILSNQEKNDMKEKLSSS